MASPKLSTHLLTLCPSQLKSATEHPFLSAAAKSTLPTSQLKTWLGQDRLYQLSYINFIGSLLSHLSVPESLDRENSLSWRTADLLIDALDNIRAEIRMFESTARGEGWLEEICGVEPLPQTRVYLDLFAGATARGRPVIVGLVVLWATEECYLRAWRFAKGKVEVGKEGSGDVMQRAFIPAWTSDEFEGFVNRIRELVDLFGQLYEVGGCEWRECTRAFRQILWAEERFWPDV